MCPGDYRPWDSPFWKFSAGGPAHPTRQVFGVDKALGLPALYSAARLIADSVASLPLKIYTSAGSARELGAQDSIQYRHAEVSVFIEAAESFWSRGMPVIEALVRAAEAVDVRIKQASNFAALVEQLMSRGTGFADAVRRVNSKYGFVEVDEFRSGGGPAVRYNGPSIFDMPSATGTLYDWLFTMMSCLILHGNAWGLITGRDGFGYPTGIEWIPPDYVSVIDDDMQPWNPMRARIYVAGRLVTRDELFHVKAFSLAGRVEGISPLRQFALTILHGIEAQKYGADWFGNGGFPIGTFQNTELEVDRNEANEIRQMLTETLRTRQALVFGRDWEYKPVVVPPEEAQFIQAMQLNATQIAAVYGLPPDRIGGTRGDSLTYNTVEQSTLQVIEALRPWLVRLETAFFDLLPANRYVRFNADALLKTDLQTRTQIYKAQRDMGLRTIDELRDLEDLQPMPGNVGNEPIPLEVMVAMSRSIRGIPKSMISTLELEMDMAVDRIQKLQKEGIAAPDMEPAVPAASAVLGKILGDQGRAMPREQAEEILKAFVREYGAPWMTNTVRNLVPHGKDGPEYIGPWIPPETELERLTRRNGNGNGRHLCRRKGTPPMAELSSAAANNLPDSAFAYIEPGGTKDASGKTAPRSKRHFPIHDEAHVRNALSRASQSPFGKEAMPKIMSAARKFGIDVSGAQRSAIGAEFVPDPDSFPERRFTVFPLEVRGGDSGEPGHIYGYAACFGKLSRRLGGFVEQVSRSAFNTSKSENFPDVVCRYNHHNDQLLGTTYARTLSLSVDETGLAYDVIPPQARADVLEYVKRGDVRHSSFAFRVYPGGDEWGVSDFNYPMRTLLDVQLIDVAPVLDPAYPDATSHARSVNGAVESLANWVCADPEEVRSRLNEGRGMEFFKRTDNIGPRKPEQRRPAPKPVLTGAQALMALMEPPSDEDDE